MTTPTKGQVHVQFLQDRLHEGAEITRANFVFDRGLTATSALFALTLRQGGQSSLHQFQWTPELEEFLLFKVPVRMATRDEEVARFANILLNNLKIAEDNFGEDFAQAVFVQILRHLQQYQLGDLLEEIAVNQPHRGNLYEPCRNYLESAIQGLSNTAVWTLKYPNDQSTVNMISDALRIVLDIRFNISLRRRLYPR